MQARPILIQVVRLPTERAGGPESPSRPAVPCHYRLIPVLAAVAWYSCSMPLAAATWLPMLLATPPVGQCHVSAVTCQWPARASSRAFQISVRTPAVPSVALSSSPGKDDPRRVVSERCQAAAGTSSRTRSTSLRVPLAAAGGATVTGTATDSRYSGPPVKWGFLLKMGPGAFIRVGALQEASPRPRKPQLPASVLQTSPKGH